MYYKSRKLTSARKRIREQLVELGWQEQRCLYPATDQTGLYRAYETPTVELTTSGMESSLKRINSGEALYLCENTESELHHLAWRCIASNPNNHSPLEPLEAYEELCYLLSQGIVYEKYQDGKDVTVRLIDWEHPERNTFTFVEGWRGALSDGFGWDLVLLVNGMPLGYILLREDYATDSDIPGDSGIYDDLCELSGNQPCLAAYDLAWRQYDADRQFQVFGHLSFISNGKKTLAGSPYMPFDEYRELRSLREMFAPEAFVNALRSEE